MPMASSASSTVTGRIGKASVAAWMMGGAAQPKLGLAAPTVAIKPRAAAGRRGGGAGGG